MPRTNWTGLRVVYSRATAVDVVSGIRGFLTMAAPAGQYRLSSVRLGYTPTYGTGMTPGEETQVEVVICRNPTISYGATGITTNVLFLNSSDASAFLSAESELMLRGSATVTSFGTELVSDVWNPREPYLLNFAPDEGPIVKSSETLHIVTSGLPTSVTKRVSATVTLEVIR